MNTMHMPHRALVAAVLAATALTTLVPAANAGRWGGSRHERGRWYPGRPVMVVREHHDGGPALVAGIAGFVLGAAMAQSHPVVVHERCYAPAPVVVEHRTVYSYSAPEARYRYEDAYSDRWWDSLDECRDPRYGGELPRVIRVVDRDSDKVVRTMIWRHDHWISDDDGDD